MAHLNLTKTHKRTYAAAGGLELAARAGLTHDQRLLVQLRASFINGCHFCINMHTKEALKSGHDQAWLDAIKGWDGTTDIFSPEENLIIEFATLGTLISNGYDRALQERVIEAFGEKMTGALISQIAAINTWNRISILSEK